MKKLLYFYDAYALKFCIAFLIILTALYPKLPSVHIIRTWVYIRLEDFFILGTALLFFIQFLRRKVHIPLGIGLPIILFWLIGAMSVVNSLIYIMPELPGYFPHIVVLNYLRRIEYMILFFIAFSSVKSIKDIRDYIVILFLTTFAVVFYGLGQHYYLGLWDRFPDFFEKYSFCFPSFQTGNEEFAKGIPLCLDPGARITSTFGGHYDLAAYLVMVIPIVLLVSLHIKKLYLRIMAYLLFIGNLVLLIFTASRVSFMAYLIASILGLVFYKKKLFIVPVLIISFLLLIMFSQSTFRRLLATIRLSSVVTNMQGQLIGEVPASLPKTLKNKIAKNQTAVQKQSKDTLPAGSGFIGLPQQNIIKTTNIAVVRKALSPEELKRLSLESGSIKLSTVSGNFIIRSALVYDISFTTRFQAEWPNAWRAFLKNPLLGSGFSTITLATDNDYFRALGETGLIGLLSFLFIFLMLGITLKEVNSSINQPLIKAFVLGIAAGTMGLMINALLIDVFEASKVAENLWMFLGIATAGLFLSKNKTIAYVPALKKFFSSYVLIGVYLLSLCLTFYLGSINNFFTAFDFTWLRWGAEATTADIKTFFLNANSLYMPLPKTIIFLLYTVFSFQPQGYHIFILFLHFAAALGVFFFGEQIFNKKLLAFLASLIFIVSPLVGDNVFSLSMLAVDLASVLSLYAVTCFISFSQNRNWFIYIVTFIFAILSLLCHPLAIVLPFILIAANILMTKKDNFWKKSIIHLPFIVILIVYLVLINITYAAVDLSPQNFLYIASVGASIAIIFVLNIIVRSLSKTTTILPDGRQVSLNLLLLIFTMVVLLTFYREIQSQNNDWRIAGSITKNILTDLRVGYEGLQKTTGIYFVNVPRKYNSAWVLPTGLTDSLWFIYQQNNPRIHEVESIEQANSEILQKRNVDNYIFIVQKDGSLKRAQ